MDDFISNAEKFIAGHLQDGFTLDEIAHFCGYSPFHFTRKFKKAVNKTVMEYVREKRVFAASEMIKNGFSICNSAMEYGFETHAGFTKAFNTVFGCCPRDYAAHCCGNYWRGYDNMGDSKITIRPVALDDVNDLWENVYSAMTPKQITEVKIIPMIEREKNKAGIELAAEVDGTVVMTLPMVKPFWIPIGFLFDNNYVITGDCRDELMKKLLAEMKCRCREMGISTLISPQKVGDKSARAFIELGFKEAWTSDGWTYLEMSV